MRRAPSELVPRPFQGPLQHRRFSRRAGARGGPRWSRTTFKDLCYIAVSLVAPAHAADPVGPVLLSRSFATSPFLSTRRRARRTPLVPYYFQGPLLHRRFSCRAGARGGPRWSRTTFKVLCNNAVSLDAPARAADPVGPVLLSRTFATSPFLLSRRRTRRTPLVPYYFQGPLQQRSFSRRAGARGGPRWSRTTFKDLCYIAVSLVAPAHAADPVGPVLLSRSFATTQFLSTRRRARRTPLGPYHFQGPLQQRSFSRRAGARGGPP